MAAVEELLTTLDLEQLEHNLFRGRSPQNGWQRVSAGRLSARRWSPPAALSRRRTGWRIRSTLIFLWLAIPRSRSSMRSTAFVTAEASRPGG